MKKLVALFIFIASNLLFAQSSGQPKVFSEFKLSALTGINFASSNGGLLLFEARTNLGGFINLKASAGYSNINMAKGYEVNAYEQYLFDDPDDYYARSYMLNEIKYHMIPVSLGIEGFFLRGKLSLYGTAEAGYNKVFNITRKQGTVRSQMYDTREELPANFKDMHALPVEEIAGANIPFGTAQSYRMALGLGCTYPVYSNISLDLRYAYQINGLIEDNSQILIGIVF